MVGEKVEEWVASGRVGEKGKDWVPVLGIREGGRRNEDVYVCE